MNSWSLLIITSYWVSRHEQVRRGVSAAHAPGNTSHDNIARVDQKISGTRLGVVWPAAATFETSTAVIKRFPDQCWYSTLLWSQIMYFLLLHTASYTSLMLAVKIENIVKMRGHNEFSHTGASKIYRWELVLPMHRQLVSVLQHFTSDGSSDSQAEMITYEHIHTTSTLTFVGRLLLCWSVRTRWWWSVVSNGNVTPAFTSSRPCPYAPQVLCYFDHSCFKTVQGLDISRETIVFHWVSCWNLSLLIRADRVTVWMLTLQRSEWYWAVSGVLTMGGVSCLDQPVLISHQVTQWCSHLLITALNQSTVRHTVTAQQCILPSQSTSTLIRPELTCLAKLGF